jgi:cytoskeleton protein RodZ
MSENSSPIGLSVPDASARAPGELLRAAREAQGLSLDHLAATLKVTPAKLAALEEGRLDQLPDASFARALAQTVCRVLKIDPTAVLAGLPAARVAPLAGDKPALNQPFKETRLAPKMFEGGGAGGWSRLLRPQWLAPMLLLLAAAVIYLLPESFEWPRWQGAGHPVGADSQASAPEQTADGVLPQPAASDALVLDPAASAAPAASQASSEQPASEASAAGFVTPTTSPLPATAASIPAQALPSTSITQSPAVAADGPVFLSVTEDSWVEVIDGSGNTRLSRIVRAGESMAMGGVSPWRMRIGHAGGVKVSMRGQPVDLTPFTRNNVARLELK